MYATLDERALTALRRERLQGLEADHYRLSLQLEENGPDAAQLADALVDLERRILVHRVALEPGRALPEGDQDGVRDVEHSPS